MPVVAGLPGCWRTGSADAAAWSIAHMPDAMFDCATGLPRRGRGRCGGDVRRPALRPVQARLRLDWRPAHHLAHLDRHVHRPASQELLRLGERAIGRLRHTAAARLEDAPSPGRGQPSAPTRSPASCSSLWNRFMKPMWFCRSSGAQSPSRAVHPRRNRLRQLVRLAVVETAGQALIVREPLPVIGHQRVLRFELQAVRAGEGFYGYQRTATAEMPG
jgi:hypothetical protein